jgi:hypothetical protein
MHLTRQKNYGDQLFIGIGMHIFMESIARGLMQLMSTIEKSL